MNRTISPESAAAALLAVSLPDIATVKDIARHLRLAESTVRAHLRARRIPGRRIGGRWYVSRQAFLCLLGKP